MIKKEAKAIVRLANDLGIVDGITSKVKIKKDFDGGYYSRFSDCLGFMSTPSTITGALNLISECHRTGEDFSEHASNTMIRGFEASLEDRGKAAGRED